MPADDRPDGEGAARALSPEARAATAGASPTTRRVEVERARRKLHVPSRTPRARRNAFAALLTLDGLVAAALLWGLPFVRWEPPPQPLVAVILVAMTALGVFVAGGYRLEVGRTFGRGAALGGLIGLTIAWVALKFAAAKLDVKVLTPPAVPGMAGAAVLIAVWLAASRAVTRRLVARAEAEAKLLFIGGAEEAARLRARLRDAAVPNPFVHFDPEGRDGALPLEALDDAVAGAVKAVILGVPAQSLPQRALADLFSYRVLDVPVLSPSQLVEQLWERTPVHTEDHAWYLFDERLNAGSSVVYQGLKRQVDLIGAAVGLVALSPVMLLTALLVAVTSRGPVLYRQTRVGRWKRPFTLYKFRTMRADAEAGGARWAADKDPRVTALGKVLRKSRLDELPQLWNVLVGQMSLVGPRPERPEFTARLEEAIPYYDLRHLVRPGITGWAQVSYRYGASLEDAVAKLEYDIYYLKHASLVFDLRILARTVSVVLGLRGR